MASSSPILLREPSSIHQEPSLPKTIPPRPPSLPTTACHPAPNLAQGTNPALDSPRLRATPSPLHQELLTHTPVTAPLTARATLNQALDTGKRGQRMLLILIHTPNPLPYMWLQLFGVGAGNMVYCYAPLPPHPRTNIKSKYETSNSPSLMVSVCMPSLQQTTLFWPWCMFLLLFSPLLSSPPPQSALPSCIRHCKNVTSLYAHTWETKTGCCTNC